MLIFGLSFFAIKSILALHSCTDPALTTFSDGVSSKTLTIPFGGGTFEAAKIKLPMGSKICSASTTIDKTGAGAGTPYIWIPLSATNRLVQIKTSDGTIVHTFSNGADNCGGSAFNDPSRITVLPGAAVWVANRGNGAVTRLGLKTGCTGDDCYECKGTYSDIGDGPRGATYDRDGNIWVGANTNDKICKYKSDGTLISCANSGCRTYGMIGDTAGNVWVAQDGVGSKVCKCSGAISCSSGFSDSVYGIGMDNEGDIWVGNPVAAEVNEIKGASYGASAGTSLQSCSMPHNNTGIAVDGNNNVWSDGHWDNQTYVIKGGDCSKVFTKSSVCTGGFPHGVAIDSDNNAWVVCRTGEVIKYAFHDDGDAIFVDDGNDDIEQKLRIDLNGCCGSGTSDQASYNYSDMTGFRTPKITINVVGLSIPVTTYPFTISDATVPGFSAALSSAFETCACEGCKTLTEDACGNPYCEVSITISSVFAGGTYTLSDLKVNYDEPPSKITGGLVPCGRKCDDQATVIREDAPCTLCATFVLLKRVIDYTFAYIVIPLAILMIVIGGLLYMLVVEDPRRMEQAKTLLTAATIGIIVMFAAWLIVNLVLFVISEQKIPLPGDIAKIFGRPWNEVSCSFCGDGVCDSGKGEDNATCRYDCP